jgi:derlin-1
MNLYFLYNYSVRLERDTFTGRPADYLFMLIFNWASIVLIAYWMNISLLMDPMVLSVLYIWCQLNKDVIVNFWFGTQFKAALLPWVLLGFNLILSGGGLYEIIGILVGHMYYFVMYKYPQDYGGPALIQTPSILYNYFPNYSARGGVTSGSAPNPRRADTNTARGTGTGTGTGGGGTGAFPYAWGRGNTLGGN